MNWKRNEGLTLVELMVAILVAAIITTAATTILLLGLRVNRHSTETAQTQYTARTVLTVLENLASEGTIASVEAHSNPNTWVVLDKDGKVLLSYNSSDKAIFTGDGESKVPLLEDVTASHILYTEDGLLTFAMETAGETYTSSVYCRTLDRSNVTEDSADNENQTIGDTTPHRLAFLKALLSQHGSVGGVIQYGMENVAYDSENYRFFSEWYVGSYNYVGADSSWNYRTPWCACFISWGLNHYKTDGQRLSLKFAEVSDFKGYIAAYGDRLLGKGSDAVQPGDLIFFDWEKDGSLDHIGAVLRTEGNTVFTIEGNSANTVAIRKYDKSDDRIVGYGVLPWLSE